MSRTLLPELELIAREAGSILNSLQRSTLTRTLKEGVDFVTEADLRSQEYCINRLEHLFPGIPIIAEEQKSPSISSPDFFTIDPLDGTRIYAEGCTEYGVILSFFENGSPHSSVMYQPALQTILTVQRGAGCKVNGEQVLALRSPKHLSHAAIGSDLVTTRYLEPHLKLLGKVTPHVSLVRCLDSAIGGIMEIVMGRTSAYLNSFCWIWDATPGFLAVTELGGIGTDITGAPLDWTSLEKSLLLGSSPEMFDQILALTKS